jgi:ABC-type uncharacterized transport system substrate-binding protein
MNRRSFLTALGGVAASPLLGRAQQTALPIIGFLNSGSPRGFAQLTTAYLEGLQTQGFVHGRDIGIDYRWAQGHYDDLPAMAADLIRHQVTLIAATGGVVSAQAAIAATSTIPIVFVIGFDPVKLGLVASLNNPGGNATGVSLFTTELAIKRLQLLHELLPETGTVSILVNPGSVTTDIEVSETIAAAEKLGVKIVKIDATAEGDLDAAFALAVSEKANAVLVTADPFFMSLRAQLVTLSARYRLPTMYPLSAYAYAGGLVSYGTELEWAYRQAGDYSGRILKGAKATDLPVMLPTDFNLVINLRTAKALGITVSPLLLARAHKVLE